MDTHLYIETTHGGIFFAGTYLVAFLVAAGMMIHQGLKRGYPMLTWLLIILTGVIFFIIGNKMLGYSPEQWSRVFTGFSFPAAERRTVLGGIIGVFAGIFLAKAALRFHRPVLDTLAIALPVAMAISRVGCLFAGCCFGTPTSLPWGIQYDEASWACQVHLDQGLISMHDNHSLPVHPAQLYQVLGCLVIALIVWKTRKQWKSAGSRFLFSILCYGVLRFVVEFVRAPETNAFTGDFFMGIKTIQWLMLGAVVPGFFILAIRESGRHIPTPVAQPGSVSDFRQACLVVSLFMLVYAGRRWFDLMELCTIGLFLVPVFIAVFVKIYQRYCVKQARWVLPALLVGSISFMAQKSNTPLKENEQLVFTDAGMVGMFGSYYDNISRVSKIWVPGDCNSLGHYHTNLIGMGSTKREFWQAGLDVSYNKWIGKYKKFSVGGRGFYGTESGDADIYYPYNTTFGISPYVSFDWQYVGFGTGFTLGQTKMPFGSKSADKFDGGDIISNEYRNIFILPAVNLRVGPTDIIYGEISFPGVFPSTSPVGIIRAGVGSGLGRANGTKVSVGYCNGFYAQAVYPIANTVVLEALYADNFEAGAKAQKLLSVGIRFRFKSDVVPVSKKQQEPEHSWPAGSLTFSNLRDVVVDVDGNVYHTQVLDSQVWMSQNLKVTHFRDGSEIPGMTKNAAGSEMMYDWSAVSDNRSICPVGWHVPRQAEWTKLFLALGGENEAGIKMKEGFSVAGSISQWWSSTEQDDENARYLYLNSATEVVMLTGERKTAGMAVRCVRDGE